MTLWDYTVTGYSAVLFFSDFIEGEFDRNGDIKIRKLPSTATARSFPDRLDKIMPEEEIGKYIDRLSRGENRGSSFIFVKERPSRKFIWEVRPKKTDETFEFIAFPAEKSDIEQLLFRQKWFENLLITSPDLLFLTSMGGVIKYINPSGLSQLGLSKPSEIIGRDLLRYVNNMEDLTPILSKIKKGQVLREIELHFRNEGISLICLCSFFPIKLNDKTEICIHAIDVSARLKDFSKHIQNSIMMMNINEELKRTQSTLLQQDKMASVGRLSAGLAHELNNPLGYIFNNITVLFNYMQDFSNFLEQVRKLYTTDENRDYLIQNIKSYDKHLDFDYIFKDLVDLKAETEEGINRIRNLINSLKSFSRKDSFKNQSYIDINKSITDILVISTNEYKYSIDINTNFGNIPETFCNNLEINQAIFNVLKNSIEAIKIEDRKETGNINIKTWADKEFVHIEIADDGPGIPENIINRIYEPFFTTKPVGSGTGLGLSIVHDIITNKHQGKINARNLEKGTAFTISLPIEEELQGET